jgi:hypothetical protein
MTNPIEIVKAHPIAAVTTILVVVGAVILFSGSTEPATADTYQSDQSAAIALQQLQGQTQAQTYAVSAQRDVELAKVETEKYIAGLEAQSNAASIAANLELGKLQTSTGAVSTDLANTLAAKISGDQIAAQTAAMQAQYATLTAQMASQAAIAKSSIDAQVKVAKINKPKSCFLGIFC